MHGTYGEDGTLQGMLEIMNIPYIGCDVLSSAVGMDKVLQKMVFQTAGLPIVNYTSFYSRAWMKERTDIIEGIEQDFSYPVIVKPTALGSSIGVAQVKKRDELEEAIDTVRAISQRILIEEAVTNLQEINCSVLGDYEHVEASVCEEPISSVHLLSFQDKYISGNSTKGMSGAKRKLPADIPQDMATSIQDMAKQAFLILQCHGVVRVDFLIDTQSNKIFVNEVNTIPGSLAFYLWEASGKSFTKLTSELIELALKRHREKNSLIFSYESNILAGYQGAKGLKGLKQ
jgi:D-alanine-D-alanine ligase